MIDGGRLDLDRAAALATFTTPSELDDDELVHPGLVAVGVCFAHWLGREALHASTFVAAGKAWGLLGERGAGKTTTVAALAGRGYDVLADDVLVIDGEEALAGPRCLDLRPGPTELAGAEHAHPARAGTRARIELPPVPDAVPLAGVVVLARGAAGELVPIPPRARLEALAPHRMPQLPPGRPGDLLALAALPVYRLSRRLEPWSLESTVDELVRLAEI
jgi:hypothetical protein